MKRVEQGTLYLAGLLGGLEEVRPVNGKEFSLEELQQAVGGYVENMISAVVGRIVYVNEEGLLKGLEKNRHTWTFAKQSVYLLNGYKRSFRVHGNALVVRRIIQDDMLILPTIAEVLR